jgi:hypothetical protein
MAFEQKQLLTLSGGENNKFIDENAEESIEKQLSLVEKFDSASIKFLSEENKSEHELFSDVFTCILGNKSDCQQTQDEWRMMFSFLYSDYFLFRKLNCYVYRDGKVDTILSKAILSLTESVAVRAFLKKMRMECWRSVHKVIDIFKKTFSAFDGLISKASFRVVTKEEHGMCQSALKLKLYLENGDNLIQLRELRHVVENSFKLECIVSRYLFFIVGKRTNILS